MAAVRELCTGVVAELERSLAERLVEMSQRLHRRPRSPPDREFVRVEASDETGRKWNNVAGGFPSELPSAFSGTKCALWGREVPRECRP